MLWIYFPVQILSQDVFLVKSICYINRHTGTECEERCRGFALCKSMTESRERRRTRQPAWHETHFNEKLSHTPHLYNSTEQLKFLNCHLLKFLLDQKIFPLLSLSFTTAEFVFWKPLIASDKEVKALRTVSYRKGWLSVLLNVFYQNGCGKW